MKRVDPDKVRTKTSPVGLEKGNVKIQRIYLDLEAQKDEMTERILGRFSRVPVDRIEDRDAFLKKARTVSLAEGKKALWLTRFKGPLLKPCPATGEGYLCCRYWIINTQVNCPLDCTYCVLQSYLDQPFLTFYTNAADVCQEIDRLLESEPKRLFRIGTGELTDSLALDFLTGWNQDLIRFASPRNFILELKTKTDLIRELPVISKRNIVVSWSLNPPEVIRDEEFKTGALEDRLRAASAILSKGYRLGFHFDPLVEVPGWETKYSQVIRRLTDEIPETEVLWISLGSLRFQPSLKKVIQKRFPHSRTASGELVRGLDGKMRYFRPVRVQMYEKIYTQIRKSWKKVFVYFCMESSGVWKRIIGFSPENNAHLDYLFHESLNRRFPELRFCPPGRKNYR
ncbi:MAG: DNA photolyase [Candidatus Omnitrophica bacterium]|nr:DNA photolyase [Candidatus Omnitrophota bacterium]